jgi:aspartyl-tRNA(Asn)/glutamyl-tRNA(Gln) amidotransferase subunit A
MQAEGGAEGRSLEDIATRLAAGAVTSRQLVEACLSRIADPEGEGARAFFSLTPDAALAAADVHDRQRRDGRPASRFAGVPIALKDNMDVAGKVTLAGSRVLAGDPPAATDAVIVARLRQAGFVPVGRAAMTEFAFSGLGLNPHYGTPANPFRQEERRIPGGSSAGAAVAVADGMACAAIGTDTGGSCRIPAAFCGLVGFKPSSGRVPTAGVYPLSTTLDCVGPLGWTVSCCATLDAVMSGAAPADLPRRSPAGLRLAALGGYARAGMGAEVGAIYDAALDRLSRSGVTIEAVEWPELDEIPGMNAKGGLAAAEMYARVRDQIAAMPERFDPNVLRRIRRGAEQDAADYINLHGARAALIARIDARAHGYDAVVLPSVPIIAPRMADLEEAS